MRQKLPNRRACVTHDLRFAGARFHVSLGYDINELGQPVREVFVHGPKPGSDTHAVISDQSVILSHLLQAGADPQALARSMLRDEDGNPASVLGAVADLIAGQCGAIQKAETPIAAGKSAS